VIAGLAVAVIAVTVLIVVLVTRGPGPKPVASATPTATPVPTPVPTPLAAVAAGVTGEAIDGIQCQTNEQIAHHIHAHVAIFVNGSERSIPEGVGIAPPLSKISTDEGPYVESGKCFYWLHTHTDDGIVHVESPDQSSLTLGQFFDLWQQPLAASVVGSAAGPLFIYVDGKKFTGDPRSIAFTPHELIQLDVGTDVPPKAFTFPPGL